MELVEVKKDGKWTEEPIKPKAAECTKLMGELIDKHHSTFRKFTHEDIEVRFIGQEVYGFQAMESGDDDLLFAGHNGYSGNPEWVWVGAFQQYDDEMLDRIITALKTWLERR